MNDKKTISQGDRFQDKDERGGVRVVQVVRVDEARSPWHQGFRARVRNEATGKETNVRVDALLSRWIRL